MFDKLLIPLDGSNTAERVLAFVPLLAGASHVPIELLAVVDISAATTHVVADKARYLEKLIANAERTSQEYLREVAARLTGFDVRCTVQQGKPAGAIIEKAAATPRTLITMATHGRSGVNRWLLGSVAEKVLRGTSRPLFLLRVINENAANRIAALNPIIVPLDGSDLAASVLPKAVELAKIFDAEIVLFRAYDLPASAYYGSEEFLPNYDELKKQVKAEAQSYLDDQANRLRAQGLAKVTSVVAEGLAADEIIRCASSYTNSLVTMGTHGRSGVQRWALGSVTETAVRHSRGPVLVLR